MTTIDLYRKHKAGGVSRENFLYEVRRDNNLPFITNLTSYDDAVKILKNKGIVTEAEDVKAEVKPKVPSTKKPKSLHIEDIYEIGNFLYILHLYYVEFYIELESLY